MDNKALYLKALETVPVVGAELIATVKKAGPLDRGTLIMITFLRKVSRLTGATKVLMEGSFVEEGQLLLRPLLETKIAFDYLMSLSEKDFDDAFDRIADCAILAKLKQLESVDYSICPPERKQFWLDARKEIHKRYPGKVLAQMKRHGFTCMSIEQTAQATGNKHLYDLVYRLYSRNIHTSDLTEHVMEFLLPDYKVTHYSDSRLNMLLAVAFDCSVSVLKKANDWAGKPLNLEEFGLVPSPDE